MSASKSSLPSARSRKAGISVRAAGDVPALPVEEILEGLAEGFFALDPQWRFIAFNRAAEEMFELKRKDVIGRVIWDVSPGAVGSEFERRYRQVMTRREKQVFETYSRRRPDRYHEVRAFPLGEGIGVAFRDATDRQNILERLRQRELALARVQEIGGVGGMWIDVRNNFLGHRSPEYVRLYGLPPETRVETHEAWVQRLHPDDRASAVERLFRAVAGSASHYRSEYRIIRPGDGDVRWISAVAEIERDDSGEAVAVVGAHIDITERKLAEERARENEEKLLAIADALPVLISYVDKDQIFRFANKTYEIWFDRPRSEIVGRRVDDVMIPAMYEARRPYLERALAGEALAYEADFVRSTGLLATEVVHVPHRDASGGVLGVYVIVTDITHRKLAERKIAESEARFRAIANSAPSPMWVTGANGRREFVNQAYLDFFGQTYAEALALDWRSRLHPEDLPRVLREEPTVDASTKTLTVEARFLRGDGQWRWLHAVSQPRWEPAGQHAGFIGMAYDVTEAKQAQEELARINETLERRVAERTAELAASEALVQSFFQHSSECHAVLVEDGDSFRFQEINPATLRLYGKTREEVVGRTTEEVLGADVGG